MGNAMQGREQIALVGECLDFLTFLSSFCCLDSDNFLKAGRGMSIEYAG